MSELTEVSGIGPSTARAVLAALAIAENDLALAKEPPVGAEKTNGVAR
ncbi:MAG: hypothetical protein ACRDRF_12635 [Pseudonocardiaceae bacterium]